MATPLREQIATRLQVILAAVRIADGYEHDLEDCVFVHGPPGAALASPHVVVVLLRWRPGTINSDVVEEQLNLQVQAWARWDESGIETATRVVSRLLADAERAITQAGDDLGLVGIVSKARQDGGELAEVPPQDSDLAAGQLDYTVFYRYRRGNPYEAVA